MGDHEGGSVFGKTFQRLLHYLLTFVIQGGCCLIKDQDRRILQKRSRNGKTLFLSSGKLHATLSNVCAIVIRHFHDKVVGIGKLGCADDFLVGSVRTAISDIFHNVSCKQVYILLHNSNLITKILQFDLSDIFSIQINGTG